MCFHVTVKLWHNIAVSYTDHLKPFLLKRQKQYHFWNQIRERQSLPSSRSHVYLCASLFIDEPTINTTKLPKRIPVFRGYPVDLVCEADGHPPPRIQWFHNSELRMAGGNLTVSEAGRYICNATNDVASKVFEVEVILKGKQNFFFIIL